jgi:copper chaperone CopZ
VKASAYFSVDHVGGSHAEKEIKRELGTLPGVNSVSISDETGNIAVDFDSTGVSTERIGKKLSELGYDIRSVSLAKHTM